MDVTRRCDYACRILRAVYLSDENYISVANVAEQEDIPYAFARNIQHDLVESGLLKAARGVHGGLALNCDPATTSLYDVLEAIHEPLSISACVTDSDYCEKQENCAYNKLWHGASQLLTDYFSAISLKDLIEQGADHPVVRAALTSQYKTPDILLKADACACGQNDETAKAVR